MKRLLLLYCLLLIFITGSLEAATYYVSPLGKDSNSGTSTSYPWATISKVNRTIFKPGDTILFQGGKTFTGGIYFGPSSAGSAANVKGTADKPIVFGSYGTGRATISSGSLCGFQGYNTSGFKIQNLIFKGPGRTQKGLTGIDFYTDVPNTLLTYIYIANVEIYGYRDQGIMFGSWDEITAGFGDVTIINSKVHDNGDSGITSYAQGRLVHKNFVLRNIKVYNNAGQPEKTWTNSGSGIVLSDVDGALIEYCEAYNNGWLNACTSSGPAGIWGYRCNNLVIQRNESHHNRTGSNKDGGGFDLDGGSTNSIMQYNYSHNNDGAGFLLAQYKYAPPMYNLTVRYNVSENDGRKNDYGGLHLWSSGSNGGIKNAQIYNNTVYLSPSSGAYPRAVMVRSGGFYNVKIRNNIFQTTGGAYLIRLNTSTDVRFEGNDYYSTGSSFKIYWAGKVYYSLSTWRSATGQEKISGVAYGYSLNPNLTDPGKGVTIGDPTLLYTLNGYKLKSTSGLIGKGLNLKAKFGTDVGNQDFFNNDITQRTSFSIGAHQPGTSSTAVAYNPSGPEEVFTARPTPLYISPNPLRTSSTIRFSLDTEQAFSLILYDLRGNVIRRMGEGTAQAAKIYEYTLDGKNLADGIYIARLVTSQEVKSVKMLVQK